MAGVSKRVRVRVRVRVGIGVRVGVRVRVELGLALLEVVAEAEARLPPCTRRRKPARAAALGVVVCVGGAGSEGAVPQADDPQLADETRADAQCLVRLGLGLELGLGLG